jgi:hypothetical protein
VTSRLVTKTLLAEGNDDQLYFAVSNGTDTVVALVTDNNESGYFDAGDTYEVVVYLVGVDDAGALKETT